ncbi:MAG TPA: thiamine phosphate synthase, partial [Polyangiaceae bacterium]|nr:thiamine phosphate synthase [Polyangiaceae bacterium]
MSVSRPEATPERERPPSRELDEATPRLVLITDPVFGDEPIARCVRAVGRALPRGALCVQLRDKRRPVVSLRVFAWRLRAITREIGALLVVNGEPAVARDVGADGVHLGAGACGVAEAKAICGRGAFVSVAAHSDDEVRSAVRDGADAVLVSPVFSTRPPSAAA